MELTQDSSSIKSEIITLPLFSIVIPTRNRASLLASAIESALAQVGDVEVIVCDNASTDDTQEMLSGLRDHRLTIVRSEQSRSAADNWNFAVSQATGDYCLALADDDYLLPGWSEAMSEIIVSYSPAIATCGFLIFRALKGTVTSIENGSFDNCLYWKSGSDYVKHTLRLYHLLDPKIRLSTLSPFRFHPSIVCFRRDLFEKMTLRYGTFFVKPETTSGYLLAFAASGDYMHLDQPLCLIGRYSDSHTVQPSTTWKNIDTEFRYVPLNGQYIVNLVVETYSRLLELAKDLFAYPHREVFPGYYVTYHSQMMKQRQINPNFDADRDEFNTHLASLPSIERDTIWANINHKSAGVSKPPKAAKLKGLAARGLQNRLARRLGIVEATYRENDTEEWLSIDEAYGRDLHEIGKWVTAKYGSESVLRTHTPNPVMADT